MFRRVRLQLTGAYTAFLLLTILVLAAALYLATRESFDEEIDESLTETREELQTLSPQQLRATLGLEAQSPDDPSLVADAADNDQQEEGNNEGGPPSLDPGMFFIVTTLDGQPVANPLRIELEHLDFPAIVAGVDESERVRNVSAGNDRYRFLSLLLPAEEIEGQSDLYLLIGRSLDSRDRQLANLLSIMLAGGAIAAAVAVAGGLLLAGRSLVPIREAMAKQQRFISDASHELRTPIQVVRANNEILLRYPERTIEENRDQVEAIEAEADLMGKLVSDLLTLARGDEDEVQLEVERLDLAKVLADVARDLGPAAAERSLVLDVQLTRVEVEGDPRRIRQLAVILLENAIKFTAEGRVSLSTAQSNRWGEFSVSDTGPGIPQEEQARVFERFYRLDSARSRAEGSAGLGLAIAQWIVEAHHGRILLESTPGQGSTFTVRLPLTR
ncbi:MAG: HAMP domain-containing sensor histidine kinase [Dehalococcoidia bacterium]